MPVKAVQLIMDKHVTNVLGCLKTFKNHLLCRDLQ